MTRRIDVVNSITGEEAEELLTVYRSAFDPLDAMTPAKQSMDDADFLAEMASPAVQKYIGRDEHGRIAAIACMTTDMTKTPWLSTEYFRLRYPDHYHRSAIFCVGTILTHPERRGQDHLTEIMDTMAQKIIANKGVLAFDCCQYNVDVVGLPDFIAANAAKHCQFKREYLGAQHYYAFVHSGELETQHRQPSQDG